MGVRQPVVQRNQADLGAVADHQKDECQPQHGGLQLAAHLGKVRPEERLAADAEHPFRRKIEEHRAEERLGDADAAEDEVLPGCLDGGRCPVERDQEHGREGRQLHGYPEHAEIVGQKGQQHGEDEQLVHGMVEAHLPWPYPAVFPFHPHVPAAEDGGGHGNEGGEHSQVDIECIDEEELAPGRHRPMQIHLEGKRYTGRESSGGTGDVDLGCEFPVTDEGENNREKERHAQENENNHVSPLP